MAELRAGEARRPSRRRSEIATRGESRYAYLTLLPVLLIMAAFSLYPIGYSVYLSLHKEVLTDPLKNPFVGFQNFSNVLHSYYLVSSLVSTAAFMAMAVPGVMIFGLLSALLLNEAFAGARILRVAILLPWAMPGVMVSIVFLWLFDASFGVVNFGLRSIGLVGADIAWYTNESTALFAVIVPTIWKAYPFFTLTLLAALQSIPANLYEAAEVDGPDRRHAERGGDVGVDAGGDVHGHANWAPTVGSTYSSMRVYLPSTVVATMQFCISNGLSFEATVPRTTNWNTNPSGVGAR